MNMKHSSGSNMIAQIAIVVHDIEKTLASYAAFFGMEQPEWFWTGAPEQSKTNYKGTNTNARAKIAFFHLDQLQLELIEPDHHPSSWRNHLDEKGEGPHHIAFVVKDIHGQQADMEAKGMPVEQTGVFHGGRYAVMDTVQDLKILIELLEYDQKDHP